MLRQTADRLIDIAKTAIHALVPVLILAVFTLIGALIFYVIEGPNEKYELEQLQKQREHLLEETAFRLIRIQNQRGLDTYNYTVRTLENYREELGVNAVNMSNVKWNFWNSAYYAMTIYTTIGYGDIAPATTTGRIMTIIYAFIGIPIALITLVYLGSLFAKLVIFAWGIITKTSGCVSKDLQEKMKKVAPTEEQSGEVDDSELLLQFPVSALIFYVTLYILIVSWLFTFWESWDYGSSLYYSLISFLTIGFGDITPNSNDWTQVFTMFLILVGLAIVSTVLTVIQKQIEALATGMTGSIEDDYARAVQDAEEEDTGSIGSKKSKSPEEKERDRDIEALTGKKAKKPSGGALDGIVGKMSLKSRVLYNMMPEDRRKQLEKHAEKRHAITTRGTQTDAYLMSRKKNLSE
ncbi:hypothetical protein QR680_018235 [Steinernema hermaphroditum]|uniref:Potassium channel domain-containing protein n=1 Tax=Steinernema hermaphroditum TaxID=289476 RepID=A0AA39HIJ9_9BILA|nr:hypothetical protein QR680_018235 [Steinernema hermaphroditum]